MLTTLRQSVGRAGEMKFLNLSEENSRFVEDDQVFEISYYDGKTSSIKQMTYCGDLKNWELDVLVMLAIQMILSVGDAELETLNYIFPDLQNCQNEGVAKKVSKILSKYVDFVKGIEKGISSHDVRYGAMDDMSLVELLQWISIVCRGGWAYEGDSTSFHYIAERQDVIRAGRALSGYEVPSLVGPQPCLDSIHFTDFEEKTKFNDVMHKLFSALPSSSNVNERLFSAKQVLFASLLEKLGDIETATNYVDDSGKIFENVLISTIKSACASEHLEYGRLIQFGTMVSSKNFDFKNRFKMTVFMIIYHENSHHIIHMIMNMIVFMINYHENNHIIILIQRL